MRSRARRSTRPRRTLEGGAKPNALPSSMFFNARRSRVALCCPGREEKIGTSNSAARSHKIKRTVASPEIGDFREKCNWTRSLTKVLFDAPAAGLFDATAQSEKCRVRPRRDPSLADARRTRSLRAHLKKQKKEQLRRWPLLPPLPPLPPPPRRPPRRTSRRRAFTAETSNPAAPKRSFTSSSPPSARWCPSAYAATSSRAARSGMRM